MNKKSLSSLLSTSVLLSDGSMGALLSSMGYPTPCPDELAVTQPGVILDIHRAYLDAGADILIADTFGSTEPVLSHKGRAGQGERFTRAAVLLAKEAAGDKALVALDMGPTGEFMHPVGKWSFEDVFSWFYAQAAIGKEAGVDFAFIETQTDLAEARAACLAARKAGLEAIVSFSVNEKGRTLTGASLEACAVSVQAAGAAAFGFNCSVGPDELTACVERARKITSLPIAVQPNAGLPVTHPDGSVTYPFGPERMLSGMQRIADAGAGLIGGCCGTTPEHIRLMKPLTQKTPPAAIEQKQYLSSARESFDALSALECPENISDPEDAYDADEDTTILTVSDEEFTCEQILELASYTKLPLCIEGHDEEKTEALLRVYPGRAAVKGCPKAAAAYGALLAE